MNTLLEGLNPMQQEAVKATEGPLLILAGAGSGKTRVLVHRVAYLVERGIEPYNILAITFTNKAANEMKERVNNLVTNNDNIWVSTFHSMCVRILRREIERLDYEKNFTIYDMQDSEKLMKDVFKELNINDKLFPLKAVISQISRQKDELISPRDMAVLTQGDFHKQKIAHIYDVYQKKLKSNNALDFDDLINKTVELFSTNPDVLERYQRRFKYIMVDEYQDTNTSQYQLIRFLSSKHENLCVVGDDDQSIYGWRGANIRNILDFEKDFPSAKVIKLEQNYRSTVTILDAANAVIKNNKSRKGKNLWTENGIGAHISTFRADTDIDESVYVADTIIRETKLGSKYSDFAVLYRTNSQSRIFEEILFHRGLPYRIVGGFRFYERKEILDLIAYLKVIANPDDSISLRRIINVPKRGIGSVTIEKIMGYAFDNGISLFDALKIAKDILNKPAKPVKIIDFMAMLESLEAASSVMPVSELLAKIIEVSGYMQSLETDKANNVVDAEDRIKNVQEFVSKAVEFEKQSEMPTLSAFLEDIALVADIDNYNQNDDAIVLMTLHSAKGLEFPNVFIIGFEENVFPTYRSINSEDPGEVEEERRLCYVGITRAKEKLYFTTAVSRRQNGMYVSNEPSRFFKEIPPELVYGGAQNKYQAKKTHKAPQTPSSSYTSPYTQGKGHYTKPTGLPESKEQLDFSVGDIVTQQKYGSGEVVEIREAGADYEVTVVFPGIGRKKFMAHLSKLKKV